MERPRGAEATVLEAVEFMVRSETRVNILRVLRGADPVSRRELRDLLSVSRTTVTRNLDDLGAWGWVRETPTGYQLTKLGQLVLDAYEGMADILAIDPEVATFLWWIPAAEFELGADALRDATVTRSRPGRPYEPIERLVELRDGSRSIRELASAVASRSGRQLAERAQTADADNPMELVFEAPVVESILDRPDSAAEFEALVTAGGADVFVYEGRFPFTVVLLDRRVAFGATDAEGAPKALLESGDESAYEWGLTTYQSFRRRSIPYAAWRD